MDSFSMMYILGQRCFPSTSESKSLFHGLALRNFKHSIEHVNSICNSIAWSKCVVQITNTHAYIGTDI